MSLRHYEWRVCGCGQIISKPSVHISPSYILWNCSGSPKKQLLTYENLADEKSMFARWRDWLFIPSHERICLGFWRFLEGSLSSQWSYLQITCYNSIQGIVGWIWIGLDYTSSLPILKSYKWGRRREKIIGEGVIVHKRASHSSKIKAWNNM